MPNPGCYVCGTEHHENETHDTNEEHDKLDCDVQAEPAESRSELQDRN